MNKKFYLHKVTKSVELMIYATSVEMIETIKKFKINNKDIFISTNNSINKSKNNSGFKNQIIPTFKNDDEDFSFESNKKSINSNLFYR